MAMGCSKSIHYGTVWVPSKSTKKANAGHNDYQIAVKLGLTVDPLPLDGSHFALVEFDDRPGVLQVHSWQDLTVVDP